MGWVTVALLPFIAAKYGDCLNDATPGRYDEVRPDSSVKTAVVADYVNLH